LGDIPQASVIDTRSDQMFPTLTAEEIDRLCRFGQPLSFKAGEAIVRVGETGPGIALVLSGEIEATQRDQAGHTRVIVTHKRGNFMGELAQLSGRPYLVDEVAVADTEIMAIAPDRLRALLIAEASLGERIMRALILRRVGLLETGAGPIIIGEEGDADVLRLTNFLRRNGHPHQRLDPINDQCGRTLIQRF
jgi:thioredoxin reductase (NADPH)